LIVKELLMILQQRKIIGKGYHCENPNQSISERYKLLLLLLLLLMGLESNNQGGIILLCTLYYTRTYLRNYIKMAIK